MVHFICTLRRFPHSIVFGILIYQHPGQRLECHLRLDSNLPELLKGLGQQVLLTQPSTRSLSAWMLMQPGHDGLLLVLLEPCPGILIAVCNGVAQELQARHLERLVFITSPLMLPGLPVSLGQKATLSITAVISTIDMPCF